MSIDHNWDICQCFSFPLLYTISSFFTCFPSFYFSPNHSLLFYIHQHDGGSRIILDSIRSFDERTLLSTWIKTILHSSCFSSIDISSIFETSQNNGCSVKLPSPHYFHTSFYTISGLRSQEPTRSLLKLLLLVCMFKLYFLFKNYSHNRDGKL